MPVHVWGKDSPIDLALAPRESLRAYFQVMGVRNDSLLLIYSFHGGNEVSASLGKFVRLAESDAGTLVYKHLLMGLAALEVEKIVRVYVLGTVDLDLVLAAAHNSPDKPALKAIRTKPWLNPTFVGQPVAQEEVFGTN